MKPSKKAYFILAAGIFILSFGILLGSSIVAQYVELNGPYKTNKISAHVLGNKEQNEDSRFTLEDMKYLQEFPYKGQSMAYASEDIAGVSYEKSQSEAHVFGISEKYDMFHRIGLKSGSFITQGNKDEMVAVVDEDLSEALFNSTNAVGMYVELYGQEFRIIGVVGRDESIDMTLTDSGYGSIYISVEHMLQFASGSGITSLDVQTADTGTTGKNVQVMKDALASIGKTESDYKIIDYNVEKILQAEKTYILIFILGMAAIIILLRMLKKRAAEGYNMMSSALKENYLLEALRSKHLELIWRLLEAAALLVLMYLIWNAIRFNLYIPAEYTPDELIDMKFFSDLIKGLVHSKVQNIGYIPTFTELRAGMLNIIQGWNLVIDIFAGLPMFFLGLRLTGTKEEEPARYLLYCGILIFCSAVLGLIILNMLHMPLAVNTKGILIIMVHSFLSVYISIENSNSKQSKTTINLRSDI